MAETSFTLLRAAARWLLAVLVLVLSGCTDVSARTAATLDTSGVTARLSPPVAESTSTLRLQDTSSTSTTGYLALGEESGIPGRLSADGPWTLTSSVPGVSAKGLTYLVRPGLWVFLPLVEDQRHGIVWVFRQSDRAIIEAYLRAWAAYVDHASTTPMVLDPAQWLTAMNDGGASFRQVLQGASAVGGHLELGEGIVLRPEVVDDHRSSSTARVLDCVLDGSYLVDRSGAPVAGSTRSVGRSGWAMDLVLTASGWKGDRVGGAVEAC
jgi:hypothetical protein